jgi:hypothetical protein
MEKKLNYSIEWSKKDREYVATCTSYPSLSYLAQDPDEAFKGIRDLVSHLALEASFRKHVKAWKKATMVLSSLTEIVLNQDYQAIIGMGKPAIPFILERLNDPTIELEHWDWALRALTGAEPVDEADAGDLKKITDAWLAWGRGTKYLSRSSWFITSKDRKPHGPAKIPQRRSRG